MLLCNNNKKKTPKIIKARKKKKKHKLKEKCESIYNSGKKCSNVLKSLLVMDIIDFNARMEQLEINT